ncbi:MAG: hypothetical protein HQL54_09855 [Magnetococcales bacterium]|nr:hypothetical protein [Magnetococcales bacterium]
MTTIEAAMLSDMEASQSRNLKPLLGVISLVGVPVIAFVLLMLVNS